MALKLKFRTLFPASVRATSPLTLVKTGLAYVFGLDITELRASLDPFYTPSNLPGTVVAANSVGFVGDGVTPNDAAFDAWWAGHPPPGGHIQFGAGKYVFAHAIDKTMAAALQSVTICGLGSDLTILYFPNAGGIKITQGSSRNSIHIRDLTITTGQTGFSKGLWLNSSVALGSGTQSDVTNVQIRGDDYDGINGNAFYWDVGFKNSGWSFVAADNLNTYGQIPGPGAGTGVDNGGSGTVPVIVLSFNKSSFYSHAIGAQLNSYWEGITFDNCNWQGQPDGVGLYVPAAQTHAGPLLTVVNCQFDAGNQQINFNTSVSQFRLIGSTLAIRGNGGFGLFMLAGSNAIITGNEFDVTAGDWTNTTAIGYAGVNGAIADNIFIGQTIAIDITGATNVTVGPNTFQLIGTKVVNPGGAANTVLDFGTGGTVLYSGGALGTPSSGVGANNITNATTLGGATFAAPGAIGGGTPSTGAFTSVSASIAPSSAAQLDTSGMAAILIADNANAAAAPAGTAYYLLYVAETSVAGVAAIYMLAGGTASLVFTDPSGVWVASTTGPALGHMSVSGSGGTYKIYNHFGSTGSFKGTLIKTAEAAASS
jgi:hypothetical protein